MTAAEAAVRVSEGRFRRVVAAPGLAASARPF